MNQSSMLWKALILCFFLFNCFETLNISLGSKFRDCGSSSTKGKINSLDIQPCSGNPCPLIKNKNSTIIIGFTPTQKVYDGTAKVHGIIAHVPIPFILPDNTLCQHTESKCPLEANKEAIYSLSLPISSHYPEIMLVIRWELVDKSGTDIACVEFPVKIMSD